MNYFLDPDADQRTIDFGNGNAYGKVDDIELLDEQDGRVLISYNAILKDDLHNCGIQRSGNYRLGHRLSSFESNPYEKSVIFRVEIETSVKKEGFNDIEALELSYTDRWFNILIQRHGKGSGDSKIYTNIFQPHVDAHISFTKIEPRHQKKLNDEFSLANADKISPQELEAELTRRIPSAEFLAIYDVGQGNANALISSIHEECPYIYFDMGCGIGSHKSTTPKNLVFCTCKKPLVILSHWDTDHWAGALLNKLKSLSLTWIVPLQQLDAAHKSFAHEIIAAGGQLLVLEMPSGASGESKLSNGQRLRFTQGQGSTRNDSGIIMAVENYDQKFPASWLLTGDCSYSFFPKSFQYSAPVAVVAPHHGGVTKRGNIAPSPALHNGYNRLIYSFGPDNKFRTTQHPTPSSVSIHELAGWTVGAWNSSPGSSTQAGDIRSTCKHSPSPFERGGIMVGWEAIPVLPSVCTLGAPITKC